jgi:inhibitor of cysteine peptidase
MREITKTDSGTQLDLRVGETLELQLPESPTTGYRWQMRSVGGPALELTDDSFSPASMGVGASGVRRWRFRAALAGAARLELEHRRGWEHHAIDAFNATIRVTAPPNVTRAR